MRKIVGIHSCREALKVAPKCIQKVLFADGYEKSSGLSELYALADSAGLSIDVEQDTILAKWANHHQGVGVITTYETAYDWSRVKDENKQIIVVLDEVEDPQNLGAILRTSWLMGVSAVCVPSDRSVKLTPSVCKVASGGAEHVAVEEVTNISQTLTQFKDSGFWVYGLGFENSKNLWDEEFPNKVVLVLGAEGKGLRKKTEAHCDIILKIDQKDLSASYNVSVSTALALAEVRRQWKSQ